MHHNISSSKITVPVLSSRKKSAKKLSAVAASTHLLAQLADRAGVDVVLVGDSLSTTVQGHSNTLSVTMDEMIYHCKCCSRGVHHALLVGDMPFLSYQISSEDAVRNAGRLVKEGGVEAVKLEGGTQSAEAIERIVGVGIPVLGHVGLLPQSFHQMGGYKVQGRLDPERIVADALAVEAAGAFAVVIEGVTEELGFEITKKLSIPTIGIGAGRGCNGQILVIEDLLGLTENSPKFVKRYASFFDEGLRAVESFVAEIEEEKFPAETQVYSPIKYV